MGRFGPGEILFLVVIVLIVFSASRMGQLGEAVGRFVHSFKRASSGQPTLDVTPSRPAHERATEEAVVVKAPDPASPPRSA